MKIDDVQWALLLVERRRELLSIIHELNKINGGCEYPVPRKVLDYVDREDAAKGLCVLAIQALAKMEAEMASLGLELTGG